MKKQFTILLIFVGILSSLFCGVKNIRAYEYIGPGNRDKMPVIHSVEIDKYNYRWNGPVPEQIYPNSYLHIKGEDFVSWRSDKYASYKILGSTEFYLDGIKNTDGGAEKGFVSIIGFWLSSDVKPGQHYVEVESTYNGFKSEKFYFEVFEDCEEDKWNCDEWETCSIDGKRTRICEKVFDCHLVNTPSPKTEEPCKPLCIQDEWSCEEWSECSMGGKKARACEMIYDCPLIDTPVPLTVESCQNAPACSADTWQCGNWGTCSPQGIQTRSCSKTFNCPSAETASPATSQYCQAPNQPQYQTPSDDLEIINQSSIIKATVKLLCPVSKTMASQGSGTIINSDGTILTNKHVVEGTAGCLVGFIDNYNDEPYFADRHIADIYSISSDSDIAILKLRNPYSKNLTAINITGSDSSNLRLGEKIITYGYPAKFGTKIKYTSGDFSGIDGYYLQTTAIIEQGNSGGGAYLKNGIFIGMPTAVSKGDLNSMGYILPVNKINSWLNGSPMAYNYNDNNRYARVSILEDIDLSTLNSLDLFIFNEDENNNDNDNADNSNNDYDKNCKSYYGANSYFTGNFNEEGQSLCGCQSGYSWNDTGDSCVGNVIQEEKSLITKIDKNLSKRMSGNILLQVEKNGEGWYVSPANQKKYYLGRPADAFNIMRNLGLGITHSELNNYINSTFPSKLSGKIMLDVEQNGEAYYVNPNNLKGYYLNRPADAFKIMREFGLGITNNDVRKIDIGEIE